MPGRVLGTRTFESASLALVDRSAGYETPRSFRTRQEKSGRRRRAGILPVRDSTAREYSHVSRTHSVRSGESGSAINAVVAAAGALAPKFEVCSELRSGAGARITMRTRWLTPSPAALARTILRSSRDIRRGASPRTFVPIFADSGAEQRRAAAGGEGGGDDTTTTGDGWCEGGERIAHSRWRVSDYRVSTRETTAARSGLAIGR